MKSILFSSALLYASVFAVDWNGPEPTSVAEDEASLQEGWTPRPTGGPRVPVDLLKRDSDGPVCGYESEVATSRLTCSPNYSCLYFTDVGLAACCNGKNYISDCGLFATCVDYRQYQVFNACSTTCDQFTYVCTNAAKPYCQSYYYPDVGVEQFGCGPLSLSTWRTVGTSFLGQSVASFAAFRFTMDLSASAVPTAAGLSRTGSARASPTRFPTGNENSDDDEDNEHRTPIGAIVGGVIGGLFAIGALIAGGIFLCLRNRKKKRNLAAAGGVAGGPTTYNSGPGIQAPEQQPMLQTQTPQQQFSPPPGAPPAQHAGFYAPPPPQDDKKPAYTTQTQSYHGSEISAPGSPPPPQYTTPHNGIGGYVQQHQQSQQQIPDRQSGVVSPVNGGGIMPQQQYTGANAGNRDDIAQLDGTGVYTQGQQQQGGGVPARRPVGQGDVHEAP